MIIAYKGFEPDLTCRGFQYELGKTYSLSKLPKLCKQGFHACILPIDVFRYYTHNTSVYTKVKLSECDFMLDLRDFALDTKICGGRIWISTRKVCVGELIHETFHLLDKLSIFAGIGGMLPSEQYNRAVKMPIKQLKDEASIDTIICETISFAHALLRSITYRLVVSRNIFDSLQFIQLVTELQQTKEE